MAAVTYATRLPLWLLATRRVTPHPRVERVLAQIPVAAFAAIVFPAVLQPQGATRFEVSNLYLYAALVTVVAAVAARGRLLPAIVLGVGTAGLLRAVVG